MHCFHCGQPLADGSTFCSKCGAAQPYQPTYQQPQQPYQQPQQQPYRPYQQPYQPYQPQYSPYPAPLSMKWYDFLVKFALIGSIIISGISALLYMTGAAYNLMFSPLTEIFGVNFSAQMLYHYVPGLQAADILYGLAIIGSCVFAFFVRRALKEYRSIGPKLLMGWYVYNYAISILYNLATYSVFVNAGLPLWVVSEPTAILASNLVAAAVWIITHHVYFKKRAHLFVN